ncbi:MAG TPA: TonB-dependent receptor [Thermoanaerobaculia bacterium]|nr:TonB-dependent receptor [Thermoanaerobaculia bacterium]
MRRRTLALGLSCAFMAAALPLLGQGIPTGNLAGKVTSDKKPLPGVTVSVSSPSLQGSRTVVTNAGGDYNVPLLPPGDYKATYEIEGFAKVERTVKLAAAQDSQIDIEMALTGITESIVVTGTAETISTTPQTATTYEKSMVEKLPVQRNIRETVLLTPGVSDTGPGTNAQTGRGLVISGSQSYESLFMVNGVVINENIRGQANDLFIEDAIQETTIQKAGISAEYGRFAGGVINVITKSGGNEVHGSFRTSLTNDKWAAPTPLTVQRTDTVNERYEATLGGFLWKDKLWYFGSGRNFTTDLSQQTAVPTTIPYLDTTKEYRLEGKLTASPLDGHRLTASYIKNKQDESANSFGTILDTASLVSRSLPQDLLAINYDGVFSSSFFAEAQYSRRKFSFVHSGSLFTDLIKGTLLVDNGANSGSRWNSPTFCGVCTPEARDNNDYLIKGNWFVSGGGLGSHDVAFGYDTFNDIRNANNHQSGSDFRIFITNTLFPPGGGLLPQVLPDTSTIIQWNPILVSSLGTNFRTNSLFANDKWRLTDRLTFNLGVRYDKNDGKDSAGQNVAKDSRVSPRLGGAYDLKGDGDWILNAGYGQYVTAIANSQADSTSPAGNPAAFQWFYRGPAINAPGSAVVPTAVAIQHIFDWFQSVGFTNNQSFLRAVNIPGGTTIIKNSLNSPYTTEITGGVSKRLGRYGLGRVQYIHRKSSDFYTVQTDLTTGRTTTPTGALADLAVLTNNSSKVRRSYDGLLTEFQLRPFDRLNVGGGYTLSHLRGNFDGETAGSGPVSSAALSFPEYKQASWNTPNGDLNSDQRHRLRVFATYDIWKSDQHLLQVSLLQNYLSGVPYGAVGAVDDRPFVHNPGYVRPPASVAYYFTARDAFHTASIQATDLAFNYSFTWSAFTKQIEVYLQPQVLNAFNKHGVLKVDQTARDHTTTASLATFNPFTTTPVEGVNWVKGPNFGKPLLPTDTQVPRTFRFSVGFRF